MKFMLLTPLFRRARPPRLVALLGLLAAACHKLPLPPPADSAATRLIVPRPRPGDATPPAGKVVDAQRPAPAASPSGRLRLLPDRPFELDRKNSHFHLTQPLVGIIADRCAVWNLQLGIYLGETPAARCTSWPRTCDYQARATGGQAHVEAGVLTVQSADGSAVRLDLGALQPRCRTSARVRLSPDGSRAAVACKQSSQVFLVDAHTGGLLGKPSINQNEAIGELCWGPAGLVALTYRPYKWEDCTCDVRPIPGVFAQREPAERCRTLAGLLSTQRAARNRLRVSATADGVTLSQRAPPAPAVPLRFPAPTACPKPAVAAASPDGRRVLLECQKGGSLYLADLSAATLVAAGPGCDACERESIVWTPTDFVQVGPNYPKDEWNRGGTCVPGSPIPSLNGACRFLPEAASPLCMPLSLAAWQSWEALLDPLGRYVFTQSRTERTGSKLAVYDLAHDVTPKSVAAAAQPHDVTKPAQDPKGTGPLGWEHDKGSSEVDTTLLPGRWLPGKFPVWEMIEHTSYPGGNSYTAYRIFTAPGHRKLTTLQQGLRDEDRAAGKVPLTDRRFGVRDDGVTLFTRAAAPPAPPHGAGGDPARDPSGRFVATGAFSLRRLADGQELTLRADGCAFTLAGSYDCDLTLPATRFYALGEDPLTAPVFRGDQLAHLYYHPGLVDDFFDGKPVAPAPAAGEPTGLPPRLSVLAADPLAGGLLRLTLRVQDDGGGVSVLRVWTKGRPLGAPIPLLAGPQEVRFAASSCPDLKVQACNTTGQVCTQPLPVPCAPPFAVKSTPLGSSPASATPDLAGK